MKKLYFAFFVSLLVLSMPVNGASPVVISEFLASNPQSRPGRLDDFGERSDWIEIRNISASTVNLLNWALTDDASDLTKWRFPATNLNAGAYMVINASGRDRRIPGAQLHANFVLNASGEYLALVEPDGVTIATQFAPAFLSQVPSVSYGFGQTTSNMTLITTNSPVRVSIPANGNDGTNWTTPGYNDSAWTAGVNGVGFGATNAGAPADYGAAVLPTAPVGYWRLNETAGASAANLGSSGAADTGSYQGGPTLGGTGPQPPQFNGFEPDNRAPIFNGSSAFVSASAGLLNNRGAFTVGGWIKPAVSQAARTGLFGQNDCVEFGFIDAATIQCWTPGGGSLNAPYSFAVNTWHHVVGVGDGSSIRIYFDGNLVGTGGSVTANYGSSTSGFNIGGGGVFDASGNFFNGQIDEVLAYHRALSAAEVLALFQAGTNGMGASAKSFVVTDVGPVMSNVNASAYIRIPFTVSEPTNVSVLMLRMRYDDGFIASINGTIVAMANAPATPAFNSAATNSHAPGAVNEISIGVAGLLLAGQNILAIQGLNTSAGDSDFLIVAELNGTAVLSESTTPRYFTQPTPGSPNSGGSTVPGPAISDVRHTPNVPLDNVDLVVTTDVTPTFSPVASVTMIYRIMFNAELSAPMFDDGAHGDGGAGDGIFGATIPASASTNGQMIRYYIRAIDSQSHTSRWPQFVDPASSAEYLGTIVNPTNVTSKLPILHLFAPTTVLGPGPTTGQVGADSQTGGRVSLFFDGEFYDNIHMALRGNTTAGYNKKSHRLEFNFEHLFRHTGPGPRLRKTSFVADYPDPTYMRQGLSFWLCELIGSPSSFYVPYRLQLNGDFYQLANHNDVHGEELLERLGYDPNGALYNAAGQVTPGMASTGGFEKKTRQWEGNADYTALANAVAESVNLAQRRTNLFEMLDLPNVINYLVAGRWVHENDDVWANMSLYHDNDGDNLWRIVSFDMNLSWGAIYYEGTTPSVIEGVQATNDIHKAHPLYGSSQALALNSGNYNRIYDAIFQVPQTREMFLRRLRTMMDTYVKPPGTHPSLLPMENKVLAWRDLIFDEAERDRNKWGWPAKGGQCNFDPGIRLTPGVTAMIDEFIVKRRLHFYGKHCITNASPTFTVGITKANNAGIPLAQPPALVVTIGDIQVNPATSNQLHEYVCVTNPNPLAVDISGWKLGGGVEFTFHPGTVMPSNSILYVSPDVKAFRARPTAPRGGMGLFVVGPYQGQLSARGEPLTLNDDRGRLVYTNNYPGNPSPAQQFLRVTEIMYNPAPLAGNTNHDAQEFEYIELKNISTNNTTLDLNGVRFINGIEFSFSGSALTNLAPGGRVLVVRNTNAFTLRYGAGPPVAGQYVGQLDSAGERVQLVDATSEEILDFSYNNSWYPVTDGLGFSLVIVDEAAAPDEWGQKTNWRPSGTPSGAPGQPDPPPPDLAPILISEVLTHTDAPLLDAVELCNPTTNDVNIGGWFLSDDFLIPMKYRIPDGTTLLAGGYVTFDENVLTNPATALIPFAFRGNGDEAWIYSGDANTNLTGYVSGENFGAAASDVSFGRHTNSVGQVHFVAQSTNTLGGPNTSPRVGPVVLSEIMYHPPDPADGTDDSGNEFVELKNLTDAGVPFFDTNHPANPWRLRGGADFTFPPGFTLDANASLLVVNFDPTDAVQLAAFRAKYGVPPLVPVFGPYIGKLNNDGDDVRLEQPAEPDTNLLAYILVDRVEYEDGDAWPVAADGTGASIQRLELGAYGNDPANWTAAAPSASSGLPAGPPPAITMQPASQVAFAGYSATFSVTAAGAPLRYQWLFNGAGIPDATNSMFALGNVELTDGGTYSVVVYNNSGSAISSNATLSIVFPATILAQPQPVSLRGSSNTVDYGNTTNNATFNVLAVGTGPVSYQWRFNGAEIPGAVGTTLTVTNVQLTNDGNYDVLITDDIGTVPTAPARLAVLVTPSFIQVPLAQTVPAGSWLNLSAVIRGNPTPFGYQWRSNSVVLPLIVSDSRTNYFSIRTATNAAVATYRLIVTNTASTGNGVFAQFSITTVADTDLDGLPDSVEISLGLNPNDPADGAADLDEDGASNRDEYIAGTNPNDENSYLRIDPNPVPGMASVKFTALTNRTYSIQYTDQLPANGPWSKLADFVARTTNRVETVIDPGWTTNRFYRVALPSQ